MSLGVGLYSSHTITDEELAEVILQAGGVLRPPHSFYFGGLIEGDAYIWIDRTSLAEETPLDEDGNILDEEFAEWVARGESLLGGTIKTWLYITIGYEREGGQHLAIRFASSCCQRWPCILTIGELQPDAFLSRNEIVQLYKEHTTIGAYLRQKREQSKTSSS